MAAVTHEGLIDLAAARVGGRALAASDEFFAPRHNLLAAGSAVFIEGKYTDRGKWMDGWETRRRRGPRSEERRVGNEAGLRLSAELSRMRLRRSENAAKVEVIFK